MENWTNVIALNDVSTHEPFHSQGYITLAQKGKMTIYLPGKKVGTEICKEARCLPPLRCE